jgi:hypothetical protein
MLRVELVKQLLRMRSLIALAGLAAVPIVAGLATVSEAGGRNGREAGLYGAAPFSALNHVAASLQFMAPLLLALVVALFGSALGAADREWGTLRYLYVQPVSRFRLVIGKWAALAICCLLATACVIAAALVTGLVIFGWHPFHRLGTSSLSPVTAAVRTLETGGYITVCMLSIGTIAFVLGLLLPRSAEALGVSIAFVVISNILDGQPSVRGIVSMLPIHYWQRWTQLFEGGSAGLAAGMAVQLLAIATVLAAGCALLARRDPAA